MVKVSDLERTGHRRNISALRKIALLLGGCRLARIRITKPKRQQVLCRFDKRLKEAC